LAQGRTAGLVGNRLGVVVSAAPVPETKRGAEVRNVPEAYKLLAPTLLQLVAAVAVPVALIWGGVVLARRRRRQVS
jgi:hypothetical protein